jgi:hypothetical protein
MYYFLLDDEKRNKIMKDIFKSIGYILFFIVALITGSATYLIVPILFIETAIKAETNMFLICLSVIICGAWTLGWIAAIRNLMKSK